MNGLRDARRRSTLGIGLLAAVALAGAPTASAVHLDAQGLGQVLLYPYTTVNAGQVTLISLVNTTGYAKAIKLRFREGVHGRAVLDFNLYLAPFDVYTGVLAAQGETATAPARLLSSDRSCIVAASARGADGSLPLRYDGPADGPAGLERTREGWLEAIEMGVVEDVGRMDAGNFYYALTPFAGVPLDCSRLAAAWAEGGVWRGNATAAGDGSAGGVSSPRGGLYGGAVVVDVADGIAFAYGAEALDGFYRLAETRLHTAPGALLPDLSSAETAPGVATAQLYVDGAPLDLSFVAGRPDAVSAVLMAHHVANEFNVEGGLGAQSEWVLTFPTRHLHEAQTEVAHRRPFGPDRCVPIDADFVDRDAGPARGPIIEVDPPPPPATLCGATLVLPWGGDPTRPSPLLGSRLLATPAPPGAFQQQRPGGGQAFTGQAWLYWMQMTGHRFLLDGVENAGAAPRTQLFGLPVIGFWAANYANANAQPGVLANYSLAQRHRSVVRARRVTVRNEGLPGEIITPVP